MLLSFPSRSRFGLLGPPLKKTKANRWDDMGDGRGRGWSCMYHLEVGCIRWDVSNADWFPAHSAPSESSLFPRSSYRTSLPPIHRSGSRGVVPRSSLLAVARGLPCSGFECVPVSANYLPQLEQLGWIRIKHRERTAVLGLFVLDLSNSVPDVYYPTVGREPKFAQCASCRGTTVVTEERETLNDGGGDGREDKPRGARSQPASLIGVDTFWLSPLLLLAARRRRDTPTRGKQHAAEASAREVVD